MTRDGFVIKYRFTFHHNSNLFLAVGCFKNGSINLTTTDPILQFNTSSLVASTLSSSVYNFTITISKPGHKSVTVGHLLEVTLHQTDDERESEQQLSEADSDFYDAETPNITIECLQNCDSEEYMKSEMELKVVCINCKTGERLTYMWEITTDEGKRLQNVDWKMASSIKNNASKFLLLPSAISSLTGNIYASVRGKIKHMSSVGGYLSY